MCYYKSMENVNSSQAATITKLRYEIGEYDSGTGATRTYFRYFNTHDEATQFGADFGHVVDFVGIEQFEAVA